MHPASQCPYAMCTSCPDAPLHRRDACPRGQKICQYFNGSGCVKARPGATHCTHRVGRGVSYEYAHVCSDCALIPQDYWKRHPELKRDSQIRHSVKDCRYITTQLQSLRRALKQARKPVKGRTEGDRRYHERCEAHRQMIQRVKMDILSLNQVKAFTEHLEQKEKQRKKHLAQSKNIRNHRRR